MTEVSCGLVLQNNKLLLTFDSDNEVWDLPHDTGNRGELGAETAERVTTEITGCDASVLKYKKKLKTVIEEEGEEYKWQPYMVEIEGNPQEGEWVSIDQVGSKKLSNAVEKMKERLSDL